MKNEIGLAIGLLQSQYGDIDALDKAKQLGFDAVDFSLENRDFRRENDTYSKSDDEIYSYYKAVGEHARAIGLIISQTHGRIRGFRPDRSEDSAVLENARRDCLATSALGAPVTVMHSITTCWFGPDFPAEEMREINFNMFSLILPFAETYGVNLALETFGDAPDYGCCDFFGDPTELYNCFMRLKNETAYGDRLSVCIDTGHCNKASRFGQPKPADVIRMFGSNISCLHLNDNDILTDQHKPPRTGSIDWVDVMKALAEVEYGGVYNMELDLRCFGKELFLSTAAFSAELMRDILKA